MKNKTIFKRNSAGSNMITKVPVVPKEFTLEQAQKHIEKNIKNLETIEYIYVVDDKNHLIGVFSSKNLYYQNKKTKVYEICEKSLHKVKYDDKREYAAFLSLQHELSAIPVVDEQNHFLGVITRHKILQILHKKHIEDAFHVAGVHKSNANFDNIFDISILQAIKHRIIWLLIGLLGGVLAAQIIQSFENTLSQNLVLAAFIPLVVYIASAVGTQLEAFAIRDFSLFKKIDFHFYFLKQFSIVLIIAFLLGGLAFVIASFFIPKTISLVIGASIFFATVSSIITGLVIPFIFRKFKGDPVNGSGPIGTIIQDIISVLIYFGVAYWLL